MINREEAIKNNILKSFDIKKAKDLSSLQEKTIWIVRNGKPIKQTIYTKEKIGEGKVLLEVDKEMEQKFKDFLKQQ